MSRVTKRERKYRHATQRVLHMLRRPFDEDTEHDTIMYGGDDRVQVPAQGASR